MIPSLLYNIHLLICNFFIKYSKSCCSNSIMKFNHNNRVNQRDNRFLEEVNRLNLGNNRQRENFFLLDLR